MQLGPTLARGNVVFLGKLFGDQPGANQGVVFKTHDYPGQTGPWCLDGRGPAPKNLKNGNLSQLQTLDTPLDRPTHKSNTSRRRWDPPRDRDRLDSRNLCRQSKKHGCGHAGRAGTRSGNHHANIESGR